VLRSDSDQIIRAAGGVLWRTTASGGTEAALVHRAKYAEHAHGGSRPTGVAAVGRRCAPPQLPAGCRCPDALKTLAASAIGRSAVLLVRNGHAVPTRRN